MSQVCDEAGRVSALPVGIRVLTRFEGFCSENNSPVGSLD